LGYTFLILGESFTVKENHESDESFNDASPASHESCDCARRRLLRSPARGALLCTGLHHDGTDIDGMSWRAQRSSLGTHGRKMGEMRYWG
jgi:hypothetical protein